MRVIKNLEDVRQVLKQFDDRLSIYERESIEFHQRRITNAHPSIDDYDYVVKKELKDLIGEMHVDRVISGGGGGGLDTDTWVRTIGVGINTNLQPAIDAAPHLILPFPVTLEKLFYKLKVGCTGQSTVIDLNLNGGTSILGASKLTIPVSDVTVKSSVTFATTSFAEGSYITLDVDQAGSVIPGSGFVVTMRFRVL